MLTNNVDVMDGLVNDVCGTRTEKISSKSRKFPQIVYCLIINKWAHANGSKVHIAQHNASLPQLTNPKKMRSLIMVHCVGNFH